MSRFRSLNLAAAAYGWLAVLMSMVTVASGLRAAVVFTFALTCPGLPIVSRLHRRDPVEQVVFAVGLSICLSTLVAESMALAGRWSPSAGMAALAGITTVGALLPVGASPLHSADNGQPENSQPAPAGPRSPKGA
jgi:hypothetical protein